LIAFSAPALLAAFAVTLLEMTEVFALVFALGTDRAGVRSGAIGAIVGIAIIATLALGAGAALLALPRLLLLGAAAVALLGFGAFLFRSTLRTYRRDRFPEVAARYPLRELGRIPFAGGLTVGLVESTEAAIVLLALAAGGAAFSALVGAVAAGAALLVAAGLVHERIRQVKTSWLKLLATSLLFAYGIFWSGEAVGFAWPGSDLVLIPIFLGLVLLVRGLIEAVLRSEKGSPGLAPPEHAS
jgi:uncharacterized membrane protein